MPAVRMHLPRCISPAGRSLPSCLPSPILVCRHRLPRQGMPCMLCMLCCSLMPAQLSGSHACGPPLVTCIPAHSLLFLSLPLQYCETTVAIKMLTQPNAPSATASLQQRTALANLQKEAGLMAKLRHPNGAHVWLLRILLVAGGRVHAPACCRFCCWLREGRCRVVRHARCCPFPKGQCDGSCHPHLL